MENKACWVEQFLQLYGKDPASMLCAAKATVKKAPGLMKGYDKVQMGIYDTGLRDWNVKRVNMEDQG